MLTQQGIQRGFVGILMAVFLAAAPQQADAQLLRRLKDKVQDSAEQAVDRKADEVVDETVDRAVDKAVDRTVDRALNRAFGEKAGGEATQSNAGMRELEAAVIQMQMQGLYGYDTTSAVTPVPFQDLKALLPASAPGLARVDDSGETTSAYGISTSQAEARYESGDRSLTLSIIDLGSMQSLALYGYAWLMTDVNIETEEGFERTTRLGDHPAFESMQRYGDGTESAFQVIIGQRFAVAANGTNVPLEDVKATVAEVDMQALAALSTYGLSEEAAAAQAQGAQEMQAAVDEMNATHTTAPAGEVIDFRVLKDMLPDRVAGMERESAEGQKGTVMGITTSSAEGLYTSEDGTRQITVSLADLVAIQGLAMMSYAWLNTEVETEDDTGHQRTTTYKGHPAYEEVTRYEDGQTTASMQVIVDQRYAVSVEGTGVDLDAVRSALDQIDLGALQSP